MRRVCTLAMAVVLGLTFGIAAAEEDEKPDATIRLSGGSVGAIVGVSWGSGTLTYKGKEYPITVGGLSVGEVGATKIDATGKVYHLKKLEDFSGKYAAVSAEATVGGGGSLTAMKNQNGVVVKLGATTQGVAFAIGPSGVDMKIKE
jgi:hypothetical protein